MTTVLIWLALAFAWHGFWRADQRLPGGTPEPDHWPRVIALVPARNEADVVGNALSSLLGQDYPGELEIVLVNDNSTDATSHVGRSIDGVSVIDAPQLQPGWAGKMWALNAGYQATAAERPDFYWLSDADIEHEPLVLRELASHACSRNLALVSLMVRLRCRGFWEKLLVPAFIFYFQLLYPFRAINNPASWIAGSAGGCVLFRADALQAIGGFSVLKGAVIDDCTLARHVKQPGRAIWLGLGEASRSLRGYDDLATFWKMVARSAFTQLRYSWVLLAVCIAGLVLTFQGPLLLVLSEGLQPAGLAGLAAYGLMCMCYLPTIRYHRLNPAWAMTLPLAALLFGLMTLHSAWRHLNGSGVQWKDRAL